MVSLTLLIMTEFSNTFALIDEIGNEMLLFGVMLREEIHLESLRYITTEGSGRCTHATGLVHHPFPWFDGNDVYHTTQNPICDLINLDASVA